MLQVLTGSWGAREVTTRRPAESVVIETEDSGVAGSGSAPHAATRIAAPQSAAAVRWEFTCRLRWGESLLTERVIYGVALS